MRTNSLSFRVYVTPEEKHCIMTSASECRMSMSAFCRTLALGVVPTSKQDLAQVDNILRAVVDLNRLGNLMKMLLTNEGRLQDMGRDMATTSIDGILVDIRFAVGKLRDMIDAIHGVPIDPSGEDKVAEQYYSGHDRCDTRSLNLPVSSCFFSSYR